MSAHSLPEDPAHWPEDPNELLGVSFGVTPRDLRRAYNRLIRIYKPEQYPEQFRRIREAYESLLRIAELFAPQTEATASPLAQEHLLPPPTQESPSEDVAATWIAGNPRPEEETPEEESIPPVSRPTEELEELWESAIAGRPTAAYERLMQLTQQYAGRMELYQRLYWLLTLWPDLDARRVPADWLVQGLHATGLDGSLLELYREQVADDPAEVLSERYTQLLNAPAPAGRLADLFEWRFQAAARLERWYVLYEDLQKLRQRFGPGEERLWLRLLFALADAVAFGGRSEAVDLLIACREEIARHEHLAAHMSHSFDRFDLLMAASAGWLQLSTRIPLPLLHLLAASWTHPFAQTRESLMEILDWMAETPGIWLDHLDEVHTRAPATLSLFGELLDRFEETGVTKPKNPREEELTKSLVLAFLPQLNLAGYGWERTRLLGFCVREDIVPEEIAEIARGFTGGWEDLGSEWAKVLMTDWPLRYICRACRLFWG